MVKHEERKKTKKQNIKKIKIKTKKKNILRTKVRVNHEAFEKHKVVPASPGWHPQDSAR